MADYQTPADEPALHRAARTGDNDAIRDLVARGADVDERFKYLQEPGSKYGWHETPLMTAARSVDGASAATVQLLLDLGASVHRICCGSPLLSAISGPYGSREGHPDRVALLLQSGADPNYVSTNGFSCIGAAARSGNAEVVRMLLDAGASIVPVEEPKWDWQVPLYGAAESGSVEAVRMLLDAGADPNFGPPDTPVVASATNHEVLRVLLDSGAVAGAPLLFGRYVPHEIAENSEMSVDERVEVLTMLRDAGVDLNRRSDLGATALYSAASQGDDDAVEALLRAGADPLAEWTPLKGACFTFCFDRSKRYERIIDMLVAAGVDINAPDSNGYLPIHCALSDDWHGPGYSSSDGLNAAVASALARNGAALDMPYPGSYPGWLPLHVAAAQGSGPAVEALLEAGADPNVRTPDGELPVDLARRALHARHEHRPGYAERAVAALERAER